MTDLYNFIKQVHREFPYEPTKGQTQLIEDLAEFIDSDDKTGLFVLKGYAGTGKTTIVSTFVKTIKLLNLKTVLLAPTGRAAKVLSSYAKKPAHTIHRFIYFFTATTDGRQKMMLTKNKNKNTLFFVDEASMIPDDQSNNSQYNYTGSLLEDLIQYVYSGKNCKMIFIGDTAQLPPVGLELSPALDTAHLEKRFELDLKSFELKEVVRQAFRSGILSNATNLRYALSNKNGDLNILKSNYPDIMLLDGTLLEDYLNDAYGSDGLEETIVVTRSNKRANLFNQEIRNRLLYKEGEIASGDLMMVVKNNYFWIGDDQNSGFIANGDIIELLHISGFESKFGFQFADVSIRLVDYSKEISLDVKVLLNTISSESPSLSYQDSQQLYNEVMLSYANIPSRKEQFEKLRKDPYFNALQIKFAYAMTCHKTQGGQWKHVFIDQGYLQKDKIDTAYFRWLYTAVTRARKKLYFINFNPIFFND